VSDKTIERPAVAIQRGSVSIPRPGVAIQRVKTPQINILMEPDCSDVVVTDGDFLEELDADVKSVVESVRRDRKEYAAFIKAFNDSKFYISLVFQSEEQKIEFLTKAGLLDIDDMHNYDNMFVNGLEVARRLGFDVPAVDLKDYKLRGKPDKYR
jgi:hypothetical protein